jgi:hypothetical protein
VGEVRFAGDPLLSKILLELPGLTSFSVGGFAPYLSDDYSVSLTADPTAMLEQIRLLHQLMTRSLQLLDKSGVIGEESP